MTDTVRPTQMLAEALRELASAAYGDPNAKWESPQTLVRDALKAIKVLQITPDVVNKAIVWLNTQSAVTITPQTSVTNTKQVMDIWLIGLFTAAFAEDDTAMSPRSLPVVTFGKVTRDMIVPPRTNSHCCLLCGASLDGNNEGNILDAVELHRSWHEDINHLRTYVGDA